MGTADTIGEGATLVTRALGGADLGGAELGCAELAGWIDVRPIQAPRAATMTRPPAAQGKTPRRGAAEGGREIGWEGGAPYGGA